MPEVVPPAARDRRTAIGAAALVCAALPTVALLVLDAPDDARTAKAAWLVGTALAAAVVPFVYWAPFRALALVPLAAGAWLAAAAHGAYWHEWPAWAHGLPLGLIAGALARGRRERATSADTAGLVGAIALGGGAARLFVARGQPFDAAEWLVLAGAAALLGWTWLRLLRPVVELASEPPLWVAYRIRGTGPGLADFPRTGPCLVIANHACWFDPMFLAKVLPRPITPIMTAKFYDKPVLRRLMRVFGVIRVPEKTFKKDAPEIQEAIAALDRGECVVMFPEGYLRRTEERPLRRFGQGAWQILKARPDTPVFAAWIEGAWGSYASYANGPPTKNKKKDFRRPLGIGVSAAATVPPELLEEHLRARTHLMNLVSSARAHLGLDPLPPFALPEKADDGEGDS